MKNIYLFISVMGIIVPYAAFFPWLVQHGLALNLLFHAAVAHPVSAFAWADVLISGAALLAFIFFEQKRSPVRYYWLPIIGLFCVGVSFALPFYLYLRETSLSKD